jgi:hypothetical protein
MPPEGRMDWRHKSGGFGGYENNRRLAQRFSDLARNRLAQMEKI